MTTKTGKQTKSNRVSDCVQRMVRRRSIDKSVRDRAVKVKLVAGQIVVENKTCGILFSFPAACWRDQPAWQRMWVARLTPWWDMEQPQWSPTSQRLRESCVKAINNLAGIQTEQEGARGPQATPDVGGEVGLEPGLPADSTTPTNDQAQAGGA